MSHILGIKFRDHGQVYYFESGPFVVALGDDVLVQTEQGLGMGHVVAVRDDLPEDAHEGELKPIFRLPTDEDRDTKRENDQLGREAHAWCRKCIETRNLDMKLVDVEVLHDRSKIVFYFTAPGRVDFRELVKDLVKAYHTRIELRQIGVRHETQMLGAIGNCGQICCCRRFMRKFAPVTIKMAKEQNLFLNPTKISGICGRLLCCLSFEQENYEQFQKKCPRVGKKFSTSLGMVKVLRTNLFRETISVLDEAGDEHELTVEEWTQALENRPAPVEPGSEAAEAAKAETPRPEPRRAEAGRPPRGESGRGDGRRDARREGSPSGERRDSRRDGGRDGGREQRRDSGRDHGRDGGREGSREGGRDPHREAERRRDAAPAASETDVQTHEAGGQPREPQPRDGLPRDHQPREPQGRDGQGRDQQSRDGQSREPQGRDGASRSSRRSRRSGRRPGRPTGPGGSPAPGGDSAPEAQHNPRQRSRRPEGRPQGGKPSREPESGS
jgi:cell fate regulator YaaT (PSP1 superfamily)